MADFAVSGRVAVVTGASRGIGEAIARELSRRGASVGLLARAEHDLERVTGVIRRAGGRAEWLACDLSDTASAAAAIAT
ncbi:MAG TPA: SDR family NAD(P)-dependent oxidoreductase, partial [Kofleriaceae bacterium]|nr:SDR family NAD(P)-dependent oxidoreductase [Kofleriaceae bacterium]